MFAGEVVQRSAASRGAMRQAVIAPAAGAQDMSEREGTIYATGEA